MSDIGEEVRVKDKVHVLHNPGYATVESKTDDGGFNVRIPGRCEMHFSRTGCQGASDKRMVYWHNPILVVPPKDPALWNAFVNMAEQLLAAVVAWRKEGWGEGSDGDS